MDNNRTKIVLVLDASGSMGPLAYETMTAVNHFIEEQRKVPGEATFTLVCFNTNYEFVRTNQPLNTVPLLTQAEYQPVGWTALLDAIGRAIDETGRELSSLPEAKRPGKVILAILTDGQENASKEYSQAAIKQRITVQQERYGWQIVFLGAGPETIAQAADIGIRAAFAMNYQASSQGIGQAVSSVSSNVSSYRAGHVQQMDWSDSARAMNSDPSKKQKGGGARA